MLQIILGLASILFFRLEYFRFDEYATPLYYVSPIIYINPFTISRLNHRKTFKGFDIIANKAAGRPAASFMHTPFMND